MALRPCTRAGARVLCSSACGLRKRVRNRTRRFLVYSCTRACVLPGWLSSLQRLLRVVAVVFRDRKITADDRAIFERVRRLGKSRCIGQFNTGLYNENGRDAILSDCKGLLSRLWVDVGISRSKRGEGGAAGNEKFDRSDVRALEIGGYWSESDFNSSNNSLAWLYVSDTRW